MSDKIPSEIKEKIDEAGMKMFPDWANAQSGHSDLYERFVQAAEYGYQLATDGREELEKEFLKQKIGIEDFAKEQIQFKDDQITALQSSLKEKDQIIDTIIKDKDSEIQDWISKVRNWRSNTLHAAKEIDSLTEKLKEKQKECEELKENSLVKTFNIMTERCNHYHEQIEELKAENERLKGFIDKVHEIGYDSGMKTKTLKKYEGLHKFKTENNL